MNVQNEDEEQIRRDALHFRLLMRNIVDYAIMTLDNEGRITEWSIGAQNLFGHEEAEVVGKHVAFLLTEEDIQTGETEAAQAQARETGRTESERWQIRRDDSRFWASVILTALRARDGALEGYVQIVSNLTERQQYLTMIEGLNDRLRRAMTETHHRVKNNLQQVSAMIDMATMENPESLPVGEFKRLSAHVRTLATMHDLLTKQAKEDGDYAFVSARTLLEKLLPYLQQEVSPRRLRFQLEDVRIPARQGASLALITNEVISNALKHGAGDVELFLTIWDKRGRLAVLDSGPGFPSGFDPRKATSTGIELIENLARYDLAGDVRFENRIGQSGGQVLITFPLPTDSLFLERTGD